MPPRPDDPADNPAGLSADGGRAVGEEAVAGSAEGRFEDEVGAVGEDGRLGRGAAGGLRAVLAGLLGGYEDGPTAVEMADVVWLARVAGLGPEGVQDEAPQAAAPEPSPQRPDSAPQSGPEHQPGPVPPERQPPSEPEPPPVPDARVGLHSLGKPVPASGGPAPAGPAAHVVRVAQPPALGGTLALARALRPLRQSVPSPGAALLDEEATAQATGEARRLLPVWRPASQRRFSVDLLIDTGGTMAVWHGLAAELCTVLERHGAFADVRCWSLSTDGPTPRLAPFRRRKSGRPAARSGPTGSRWSRPLEDPTGRALLLVLTDGVGPAWYGTDLPGFLARAAGERPAAALQVLPRRLWHRTALRTAPVELRVADAARPVPQVRTEAAVPGLPRGARPQGVRWLPVMEVDGAWLAPWAGLVAGRVPGWSPMLAAPVGGAPRPPRPPGSVTPAPSPAERVARFRSGCSPDAFRLACHLAAAPLSLPVMRLVQQATVPGSGQTDLAELFLSGLIERRPDASGPSPAPGTPADPPGRRPDTANGRTPGPGSATGPGPGPASGPGADPDEVVYDFVPGVRDALLAELTRTESLHVLDDVLARVSGRVAATFGGTLDFRALAALAGAAATAPAAGGNGAAPGRLLPERSLPFAEVAAAVLGGAGGEHRALAEQLAAAAEGRVLDGGQQAGREPETGPGTAQETAEPDAPADPVSLPHPELLLPVPPIISPPDPVRMIGRTPELATLERALRPFTALPAAEGRLSEPSVAVVEGAAGSGRGRLVQEYVRQYGARHSFVHRVDARTQGTLREGLAALEAALTPEGEEPGIAHLDVWDRLAEHRDWLLVFDRLRSHGRGLDAAMEDCLPRYGRGSVLITTTSVEGLTALPPTVVRLGELTRAEIMDHLTAGIEPGLLGLDRGTPSKLFALAQRMPTSPDALAAIDVRAEFVRLFGGPGAPVAPLYEWATAKGDRGLAGYVSGGSVWLAAAGYGTGVHLWDSAEGAMEGTPLADAPASVRALTTFADANGRPQLGVAGIGGAIGIWDIPSATRIRSMVADQTHGVTVLMTFTGRDGQPVLLRAGQDISPRCWNPDTGADVVTSLAATVGRVRALTVFTGPDERALCLYVTEDYLPQDRTVHVRDVETGEEVDSLLPQRLGAVDMLATVRVRDRPDLIAAVGDDGAVTLWDTASGTTAGTVSTGDTSRFVALTAFNGPYGRPLLATASSFGRAQVWDVEAVTAAAAGAQLPPRTDSPDVPLFSPDQLFSLWLLAFLDTGNGVPVPAVSALLGPEVPWADRSGPYRERLVDVRQFTDRGLAETDEAVIRLTARARTALHARVTDEDAARFRRTLVETLSHFYAEPTPDPASWAPYETGPSFAELTDRVLETREDRVFPAEDPVAVILMNWSRYHLLRGDPAEADRLATTALGEDRTAPGARFSPAERQEWSLISLRARLARGRVREALRRCEDIGDARASRSAWSSAREEAMLARAELALWQGHLGQAREDCTELELTASSARARRLAVQGTLRYRLVTGDLASPRFEDPVNAAYRDTETEGPGWAERELLDSGRDALLLGGVQAARDEVSPSTGGAAVSLFETARHRLRTGVPGTEAGTGTDAVIDVGIDAQEDLGALAGSVTTDRLDLYVALTEQLALSLAQHATGALWAERRPYGGDRHQSAALALRHIERLRPFRDRTHTERPHLYARFKAAQGHVRLAAGDFVTAAGDLMLARAATLDVYGPRSPLLPRLDLLLARAHEVAGDRPTAQLHLADAESLLDSLYSGRPHQDRVTALRAKSLVAGKRSAARTAADQAEAMAAALLTAPGGRD
jgi:hypothetical protein